MLWLELMYVINKWKNTEKYWMQLAVCKGTTSFAAWDKKTSPMCVQALKKLRFFWFSNSPLGIWHYIHLWVTVFLHVSEFWNKKRTTFEVILFWWFFFLPSTQLNWIKLKGQCKTWMDNVLEISANSQTGLTVFCPRSQLASEIICLNRRDRTSQGASLATPPSFAFPRM